MSEIIPFKEKHTFEARENESSQMLSKYPNKGCFILERSKSASDATPYIHKRKFLVSLDMTFFEFIIVVRNRFNLNQQQSLLFFVNDNVLVPSSMSVAELFNQYRDHDGFVYLNYTNENTFG